MRRLSTFAVALMLSSTTLAAVAIPVSAASDPCMPTSASTSEPTKGGSGGGHAGMDTGNSDMDMSKAPSKQQSSKAGKQHSCPTVDGAREITLTGEAYAYTPSTIAVAAGEDVTLALTAGDITHDLYVKGVGHVVQAKAGQTARGGLRFDEPGTYTYWCTVKGHKKAGMSGTITVT